MSAVILPFGHDPQRGAARAAKLARAYGYGNLLVDTLAREVFRRIARGAHENDAIRTVVRPKPAFVHTTPPTRPAA